MNCGYEKKWSYDPRSYELNFCNCVKKPENFRLSTGFEPVTSRYRYREITGSNPVEVLNFSGFFTQLQKLRS